MIYLIDPVDNFFFRTSVPFEAGVDMMPVSGSLPPLPSVYAGAFRPLINVEPGRRFRVGFNGLWLGESPYFPKPLDLYQTRERADGIPIFSPMKLKKKPLSNFPLPYYLTIPEQQKEKDKTLGNWYLTEADISTYLNGEGQEIAALNMDRMYIKEELKTGIQIDPRSGVSADRKLYDVVYIRPDHGLKLAVELEGVNMEERGIIRLGGEGKTAKYTQCDRQVSVELRPHNASYFKLYFATPTILKNGWLPAWIDPDSKTGCFQYKNRKIQLRLVSACVGRRVLCGGFGYAKGKDGERGEYRPRELRYAIPAGSVYYFEILRGSFEDAVKLFHKKCVSDYREGMGFDYQIYKKSRYCDRGFGYAFVGRLDKSAF